MSQLSTTQETLKNTVTGWKIKGDITEVTETSHHASIDSAVNMDQLKTNWTVIIDTLSSGRNDWVNALGPGYEIEET